MIDVIVARWALTREDAYMLCSLAGDLRILEIVDGESGTLVHDSAGGLHLGSLSRGPWRPTLSVSAPGGDEPRPRGALGPPSGSHATQWLSTACKLTAPVTISAIATIRIASAGSPRATIPTVAVPAAPIPVHTA
jgi:hypothetical protein